MLKFDRLTHDFHVLQKLVNRLHSAVHEKHEINTSFTHTRDTSTSSFAHRHIYIQRQLVTCQLNITSTTTYHAGL